MDRNWFTGFLFANPSFGEGVARCFDLGNTLVVYNDSPSGEIADFLAFSADNHAIAKDLKTVLGAEHGEREQREKRASKRQAAKLEHVAAEIASQRG